jgi:hypothetical protein
VTEDEEPLAERVATLETTVAELCDRLDAATNRDIPLLKGTVRAIVNAEIDNIGELPDAGREFHRDVATHAERLDAVEEQLAALGDIGAAKTTKEEKLAAIVTFAQNKRGNQSATVAVTATEIRGCVGVSRRYAYDLIDEAADTLDGARVREATDVQTSTGVEHKKKALLVDCEAVHPDGAGVNEFTTQIGADGTAGPHSEPVEGGESG